MKIEDLSLEEREFVVMQTAADRNHFVIYTEDPVWIERLRKLGIQEHTDPGKKTRDGIGKYYHLPANQLTIRKRRELTPEEKERKREQIARNMGRQRRGEQIGEGEGEEDDDERVDWKPEIYPAKTESSGEEDL